MLHPASVKFVRYFNPRSPHGERHCKPISRRGIVTFQSTLPARGATSLRFTTSSHTIKFQSTLPARGATTWQYAHTRKKYFNPRSPHGERRQQFQNLTLLLRFQSTLPARGATTARRGADTTSFYFNPRSPHGERHNAYLCTPHGEISIHAPRTGSDKTVVKKSGKRLISIHAPRTGSDT